MPPVGPNTATDGPDGDLRDDHFDAALTFDPDPLYEAAAGLSENTVKSHVQEIFRKLDVRNRVEAALLASKEGWV